MDKAMLIAALEATLAATDEQMRVVMDQAAFLGKNPYQMRNPDGSWPMVPLISARATVLAAMVTLRGA